MGGRGPARRRHRRALAHHAELRCRRPHRGPGLVQRLHGGVRADRRGTDDLEGRGDDDGLRARPDAAGAAVPRPAGAGAALHGRRDRRAGAARGRRADDQRAPTVACAAYSSTTSRNREAVGITGSGPEASAIATVRPASVGARRRKTTPPGPWRLLFEGTSAMPMPLSTRLMIVGTCTASWTTRGVKPAAWHASIT